MLIFGNEWNKGTAYEVRVNKEGKYLYLTKPYDKYDNKEYRMDLSTGEFARVNHYKTTGTKITPVKVKNITKWFSDCALFCDDKKFYKVILYSKYLSENRRYKSAVRFVESLTNSKARKYEAWLSLGIQISDIEKDIERCIQREKEVYWKPMTSEYVHWGPSDFSKSTLKYIKKNFSEISSDAISEIHYLDSNGFNVKLISELLEKTSATPQYREFFTVTESRWREPDITYNIFDMSKNTRYSNLYTMKTIIECIERYNLDVDSFLNFCLRMYNVEGLDLKDLFETRHYKDYLNIEKILKNHKMTKMDKYPQHFLSTFHISKREYAIRKQELDENAFKHQCDNFRHLEEKFKKYSIVVPKKTTDIEDEADGLKHCVRMYIPKVINGDTLICFLRDNEDIDTPLITIEVKEGFVTQAYGLHDSKPSEEQLDVLRKWAKKHSLKLSWAWD